ncbi:MAG: hypothetical protein ACJ8AT_09370 [Hyalangium sp.]|uniref:hypothetical protein n=1 Tax=Hyalangium sp. TaxID=2028555 RepID=UPI00389B3735
MRRGVWVVLGLMGAAPGGALAQGAQRQPTEQTQGASRGQGASNGAVQPQGAVGSGQAGDNSGIILEIPQGGVRFPGILGAQRSQSLQAHSGTGGSGLSPRCSAASTGPNEDIFVGTLLRSATPGRLVMRGPSQRVYEFGLGERMRVLGPDGAAVSLQALKAGTPVRTVTRPGDAEDQVVVLQVLKHTQPPSR